MSRTGLVVIGIVLALFLAAWAAAQEQPPKLSLRIELRPGPPIGQTPEAAAASVPPQAVFDEGQPIDVAFIVTNVGEQPYRYTDRNYDRSGRMGEYAVEVTDTQGKLQDDPRKLWGGGGMGGGICGQRDLVPQASFTKHIYLNQWVMPLPPGKYSAQATYPTRVFAPVTAGAPPPRVQSEPIAFEIRPRGDMAGYVAALAPEARSETSERRVQAVRYLGFAGTPLALPYLIAALYDNHQDNTRFQAHQGFMHMRDVEACRQALLTSWNERGPDTSLQGLLTHYQVPLEQTLPALVKALGAPEAQARTDAARCFGQYSKLGEAALTPLVAATLDVDAGVRAAAAGALWSYTTPPALAALLAVSRDPDPKVREAAALSLGHHKEEPSVQRLQEMLLDVRPVALMIVFDVSAGQVPMGVERLRTGLQSQDELVRVRVAVALLGLGDDSVRGMIADFLERNESSQDGVCGDLGYAAERRKLTKPTFDYADWRNRRDAWVKWLRGTQ